MLNNDGDKFIDYPDELIKILFIGDIIGKPGRTAVQRSIGRLVEGEEPEFIIANGENAAHGMGITPDIADFLLSIGIDVITTGNHIWDQKSIIPYIGTQPRLLRPGNYPESAPGTGFGVFVSNRGNKIGVINLEGRVFMKSLPESPFSVGDRLLEKLKGKTDAVIIDFHAEATSEKEALALYLDGRVSAVIGTHTHVQTNDDTVFPGGTAYISDAGMVGSAYSVLGTAKEAAIRKYLTGVPERFEPQEGNIVLNAVSVTVEKKTGFSKDIKKIRIKV